MPTGSDAPMATAGRPDLTPPAARVHYSPFSWLSVCFKATSPSRIPEQSERQQFVYVEDGEPAAAAGSSSVAAVTAAVLAAAFASCKTSTSLSSCFSSIARRLASFPSLVFSKYASRPPALSIHRNALVVTRRRRGIPRVSLNSVACCTFGTQVRRVCRSLKDTLFPNMMCFPAKSPLWARLKVALMVCTGNKHNKRKRAAKAQRNLHWMQTGACQGTGDSPSAHVAWSLLDTLIETTSDGTSQTGHRRRPTRAAPGSRPWMHSARGLTDLDRQQTAQRRRRRPVWPA